MIEWTHRDTFIDMAAKSLMQGDSWERILEKITYFAHPYRIGTPVEIGENQLSFVKAAVKRKVAELQMRVMPKEDIGMNAQEIMEMPAGMDLHDEVYRLLGEYENVLMCKWSTEDAAALELWEHVENWCHCVCIARMGTDSPPIIGQMVAIGDNDDRVTVYMSDWREALCKAFLLWENGHRGDYMHPEWERKVKQASRYVVN